MGKSLRSSSDFREPTHHPRQAIELLAGRVEATAIPVKQEGPGRGRGLSAGNTEGIAVFTFMSLWFRPYWDLIEYHACLRYEDGSGAEPVDMTCQGSLSVPGDMSPGELLVAVARAVEARAESKVASLSV
jgi:hypothetical protein